MNLDSDVETRLRSLELDGTLLVLDPETESFFKLETGIQDSEELRKHIVEVHKEAYKVFPYPSIRTFRFAKLKIARLPAYPHALELLQDRPDAVFLDIGCCLGAELRKVIHDGWPISQAIATDVEGGFWGVGHELFRTTPETYPAKFLAGDAFDDAHLCPTSPIPLNSPSVASVSTLTELRGRISVIHASSLFHLFDEEKQLELAKRLASLLDPRPGSIIFGSHGGNPVKGWVQGAFINRFSHSPESWTELWERIFGKGQVKITTALAEVNVDTAERLGQVSPPPGSGTKAHWLVWSVERL